MSDVWVANASPVITLAKAGCLELLAKLPSELLPHGSLPKSFLWGDDSFGQAALALQKAETTNCASTCA